MSGVTTVPGVVLASGAGGPKALRRDAAGVPWVVATARAMAAAGCAPVVVTTATGAHGRHAWDPH